MTLCAVVLVAPISASALTAPAPATAPLFTLANQTQWVTPEAPWYSLSFGVGAAAGPASDLHVSVTFYSRITDGSQLQQATNGTPDLDVLTRVTSIPVVAGPGALSASTCVTVLPRNATVPTTATSPGACPADAPTVNLPCALQSGPCDDVYPVSVALVRTGQSTPVSRFTTFMTYEEPGFATAPQTGGPLRVSWIVPISTRSIGHSSAAEASRTATESLIGDLAAHRGVATTLDLSPVTANDLATNGGRAGQHALRELSDLTTSPGSDQLMAPSYVPINVTAMAGAGLATNVTAQVARGTQVLKDVALRATSGLWVDTNADLSTSDLGNFTTGLEAASTTKTVVSDAALASPNNSSNFTYAQPFTLTLAHGSHVAAVATNTVIDSRFSAHPSNPVLAANQLLAGLSFVHFEDEFEMDPRGIVLVPPSGWQPSSAFVTTLLSGLTNTQIVSPVTTDQLFAQVPVGGNNEPTTRHLQTGTGIGNGGITPAAAARITAAQAQLNSFSAATIGHPAVVTNLADGLFATQSATLTPATRSAALNTYDRAFSSVLSTISLAVERTITFTSRTAPIPITVLSSAPYGVRVVLSLASDKFTFPTGASRSMVLNHSTTSVRIEARARTSGDRLPITVTLRTPDGDLTISHAVVTVHSTAISIVGIALTVLAGLVLLVWWIRTWRRNRTKPARSG